MNLLEKEPHVQLEVRHDLLLDPPHSPSHGQPPHPAGGDVTLFLPPLHLQTLGISLPFLLPVSQPVKR